MKLIKFIVISMIVGVIPSSFAATCDENFYGQLRHGNSYTFGDIFSNNASYTQYGLNKVDVTYNEQRDYNGSSSFPSFSWTNWITSKNYILKPGESGQVIKADSQYPINYVPVSRNQNNLVVRYKATYYSSVDNGATWSSAKTHTECKYYEVTWCGDGIVDSNFGEICDPNDSSQRGWGSGGCSVNTCRPIEAAPACNSLTVNRTSGEAPTSVTATCSGFKVNTWKIDCGNGQVFDGTGNNSGNQTFTGTCNYTSAGSYTPRCTINNTITNNSCSKNVNITNPVFPNILVDKRDQNVSDLDGNVGNDTQTVNKGENSVFKIRVTNNGQEALRDIRLIDNVEISCASSGNVNLSGKNFVNQRGSNVSISVGGSGNHSNSTLEPGEWFEYTCRKTNTQSDYVNEVTTNGTGVNSGIIVNDSDPTQVIVVVDTNPQILVDKRDANPADLDGSIGGNDSQTVNKSDSAVFRITVTNNGTEDLKDITLIDSIAPACASNGIVNLSSKNFQNKQGATINIIVSGVGNHNDSVFQVGEVFMYECIKTNTQADYTNTVIAGGVGVISGTNVSDSDPTEVILGDTPNIEVIKQDANPADLDTIQFNDTQTVTQGSEAVFHITVKNTGSEDLKDIMLVDAQAPACASNGIVNLAGSSFTNIDGQNINIFFGGAGNPNDAILQIGEEFTYTCKKGDTQVNYTNIVEVSGVGIISGTPVTDDDPTVVVVESNAYDLALRKTLSNTTTGPFSTGSTVTFDIRVFNQGNIDSGTIEITDYIPTGLTLNDTAWSQSGTQAKRTLSNIAPGASRVVTITFTIDLNAPTSIKNFAEISSDSGDDCDSTPDNTNGNGSGEIEGGALVNDDIGSGCQSGGDEDDHDIEIITLVQPGYDLALRKVISSVTPGPFDLGDPVTFTITVFNQGTLDSGTIEITDYIPTGLTLNDTAWSQTGNQAKRTLSNIAPGANTSVNISFTIDATAPANIDNFAEISSDNGDDCDSTPDSTNGNGSGETTGLVDNSIGNACNPGGDEDDHDIASISIGTVPACTNLTASPSSAQDTLTTTLTCSGIAATSFKIEVRDEAGNIVNTINNASGSVTLSRGSLSTANFTAKCFINGTITSPSCEQNLQVTSPGGGGNPARCLDIIRTGSSTYQCIGNSNANSISMRCGTDVDGNTVYLPTQEGVLGTDGRKTASFSCADDAAPRCYVRKIGGATNPPPGNWVTTQACVYDTSPICGDGVVDPATEVCDLGSNNGKPGFACTASCTLPGGGSSSGGSSGGSSSSGGSKPDCNPLTEICSITTTPTGGEIAFGPFGGHVVGHNKNVLASIPAWPFIENKSEYDYSFAQLCIKKTSGDDSVTRSNNEICVDMTNKMLYGYEKFFLAQRKGTNNFVAISQYELADNSASYVYPDFMSNKDAIPAGKDYGEATLTTSIKDDIDRNGTLDNLYNAYFAADLDVRVAKPSIATIGGGVSYIKKGSETTGDIRKVTDGINGFDENNNFVGVSVSDSGISSYVDDNTSNEVIENTKNQNEDFKQDVKDVIQETPNTTSLSGFDKFTNFNGLDNVYILKGANITLDSLPSGVNAPRTYIVEGGNITFTKDIVTNENIAFVVKGGNMIVKENVTELSGTYISIPVGSQGGKILSESSSKQLIVFGSLLGNLDELISNRYFIEKSGGQLSVGTIVSFGSRLLSKPAPMVAQFKSEYNASQKIVR